MVTLYDCIENWKLICIERDYICLPRVSEEKINFFKSKFFKEMGYSIDEGYINLLKLTGGLEANGFIIYTSERTFISEHFAIDDIIEMNLTWREGDENLREKLIFGESELDFYMKDLITNQYQVRSRNSEIYFEAFDRFEDLLDFIIRKI